MQILNTNKLTVLACTGVTDSLWAQFVIVRFLKNTDAIKRLNMNRVATFYIKSF
ncbi:hypothetical protein [Lactobacillus amylolyticus]|uniref:hypothetical protein n=1 Tax=Lactobacillus amylolyticus TaxID=83683 RepID=UPI0013DFF2CD|nr:hypothetical protein [Lactobacillus amylolyticus]